MAERHSGTVGIPDLLDDQLDYISQGKTARVFEGIYHDDGVTEDTHLDEEDGWIDLGPEDTEEKAIELEEKLNDAQINDI